MEKRIILIITDVFGNTMDSKKKFLLSMVILIKENFYPKTQIGILKFKVTYAINRNIPLSLSLNTKKEYIEL